MAILAPADRFLEAVREHDRDTSRRVLREHPDVETSSIFAAAAAGRDDVVARELAGDAALVSSEHATDRGTPLAYACGSPLYDDPARADGIRAIVTRLLDAGADQSRASVFTGGGENAPISALYYATMSDNRPVMRLLLERGASTQDGESIYHGAQHAHLEALALLVEFGADLSAAQSPYGNTPLYFLAGHRNEHDGQAPWLTGVRWLLEHGADPNVPSYTHHETPLHAVARSPQLLRTATALLDHGADPNRPRKDGVTPYAVAVRRGSAAMLDVFRRHFADGSRVTDVDRFVGACVRADAPDARRLLATHPSLVRDLTDEDQQAVRFAIQDGSVEALELMRAVGFDVMREVKESGTPLHEAAWLGQTAVVRTYLEWGASPNARDQQFGSSPLGWTAHGSKFAPVDRASAYVEIIDTLAASGAEFAPSVNRWNEEPASMATDAVAARLRAHKLTRDTRA